MGSVDFDKQVSDLFKFYKTNIIYLESEQERRESLLNYFEENGHSVASAKKFLSFIKDDLKVPVTKADMIIYISCIVAATGTAGKDNKFENMFVPCIFVLALIIYTMYRQITKRNKLKAIIQMQNILK
jgi:hypothetical protein